MSVYNAFRWRRARQNLKKVSQLSDEINRNGMNWADT